LYGLHARCRTAGICTPSVRSKLFHTLVIPALSHCCQVWGVGGIATMLECPQKSITESVQLMFLRGMAGVGSSCHIQSLLSEFGHIPIVHRHLKLAARFWNKMRTLNTATTLHRVWKCDVQLALSHNYKQCWSFHFLTALEKLDMCPRISDMTLQQALDLRVSIPTLITKLYKLSSGFLHPSALGDMRCPRSCPTPHVTAVTYRYWVGMTDRLRNGAPHVRCFINASHRFSLTRLRLGCSDLRIVQGRRRGLSRANRTCQVHSSFDPHHSEIEDIRHFLLECPAYEGLRLHPYFKDLFSCVFSRPLSNVPLTTSQMIRNILMHHDQSRLAMCIHRMFMLRSLILQGLITNGQYHHDLPRPNLHPVRSWWLLGSQEDVSRDIY